MVPVALLTDLVNVHLPSIVVALRRGSLMQHARKLILVNWRCRRPYEQQCSYHVHMFLPVEITDSQIEIL